MIARPHYYVLCLLVLSSWMPLFGASQSRDNSKNDIAGFTGVSDLPSKSDSLLLPDDVLRVQVFQEEDINKQGEVRVSQDNTITLPLIGVVNLKGKTVRDAEEIIRALYDKDYLVNPQVTVTVLKFAERFVNVVGAVNTAGQVAIPPNGLTIVDAIARAGGQSRIADLKHVKLTRRDKDGDVRTIELNVEPMMKTGGRDAVEPLPLEKDDSIFVPERIL